MATTVLFILYLSIAEPGQPVVPPGAPTAGQPVRGPGEGDWRRWSGSLPREGIRGLGIPASPARTLMEKHKLGHRAGLPRRAMKQWAKYGPAREHDLAHPGGCRWASWPRPRGEVLPSILGVLGMTLIGIGQPLACLPHHDRCSIKGSPPTGTVAGACPAAAWAANPPGRTPGRGALLLEARLPGLVGTGLGHHARGLSLAPAGARGEDDVADPADHGPSSSAPRSSGKRHDDPGAVSAIDRHRGDGLRALRRAPTGGQPIRLRPRRLSRVRALRGALGGTSSSARTCRYAPITLGMSAGPAGDRAGSLCPMRSGPLPGHRPAVPLDVPPVLPLRRTCFRSIRRFTSPRGTLKPSNPKLRTILLQLVMFMVLFPLIQARRSCRWVSRRIGTSSGWSKGVRSACCCPRPNAGVVVLYRVSLGWHGRGCCRLASGPSWKR